MTANYDFPVEQFIDKAACNQDKFLEKFPQNDGRGILIAIIDSGVDPDLPSMKITTTGERKLVDLIDCSGENDVDTSVVRTATNGVVEGLTGRKLKIPDNWKNPTNQYHLGVKPIFELFNKDLVKRVKESRAKIYKSSHLDTLYEANEVLEEDIKKKGKSSKELSDIFERTDLLERIEFLKKAKDLEDCGDIADVLVWNDGEHWKACLDTSYCGSLSQCTAMSSFRVDGEYSKISLEDQLSYSFRIASDGNWVQIVVPRDSHGTHVADIAAGYYPNEPKKNGLAPGARVISIVRPMNKISQYYGDLMEALNICIQMKVDIINFSLWLRFDIEHYGKLLTELSDIAYKHNIVIVKSGGNFGPCLSTVDTVTALGATISVSACMTKSLKETVYSSFSSNDGYMCDYSARGPSLSGALALSVSAPGSALAAISRHELSSCKVKKGTSMSSPYVAGVVACLLSGLRSQNRQWNPYQIKRALENTAKTDSDHFCKLSNGQGLVQICEAYDYLTSTIINKPLNELVTFATEVENESNNDTESIMRTEGIYIRTKLEQKIAQHRIAVVAEFQQTDEGKLHQLQFEQKIRLVSDRDWIKAPDHFFLAGTKSSFDAKIDYSAVPKGDVVYSEIVGLDTNNAELGPLFRVPITVINPIEVTEETKYKCVFTALISPIVPYRKFVEVPSHSNIMVLNVSTDSLPVGDKLKIHLVQMRKHGKITRSYKSYKFANNELESWENMVTPGETIEICLFRTVSDGQEPIQISVEVIFKGVQIEKPIVMKHSNQMTKVSLETKSFTSLNFKPEIVLKKVVVPLKVTKSKITQNDTLFGVKSYRLLLTYKLETNDRCIVTFEMDKSIKSQLLDVGHMVFDSNNCHICAHKTGVFSLDKGKYTICAQILHSEDEVLKKLKNITISACVPLHSSIEVKLSAFSLPGIQFKDENSENRDRLDKIEIGPNSQKILYFRHVHTFSARYSPVTLSAGCFLEGSLQLRSSSNEPIVDGLETPVKYYMDECSHPPYEDNRELIYEVAPKKTPFEEYEESLRNIGCFTRCKIPEKQDELYIELTAKYPTDLQLHVERLNQLLTKELTPEIKIARLEVIQTILDLCNPEKVLSFFGGNNTYVDRVVKCEMGINKMQIIATLQKKFTFIADEFLLVKEDVIEYFRPMGKKIDESAENQSGITELPDPNGLPTPDSGVSTRVATPISTPKNEEVTSVMNITEVNDSYMELLRWIKEDDGQMLLLSAKHAICNDHYGRALFYLSKHCKRIKEVGFSTKKEELTMGKICEKLNWTHIANRITSNILIKNPASFRAFKGNHCKFD